MDYYGFSSGVNEANALQNSGDLANSEYDAQNTGANDAYIQRQVDKYQKSQKTDTDADTKLGKQQTTADAESGFGTGAAGVSIVALGKSVKDTTNSISKAIRVAEAQVEITKNAVKAGTATAEDVKRASGLLDVAKSGKLAEFAKSAASLALTKAVSAESAKNIVKIGSVARDAQKASSFAPAAAQSLVSKGGRQATQILSKQAEVAEEAAKAAKAGVSALAGGKIAATGVAEGVSTATAKIASATAPASQAVSQTLETGIEQGTAARPNTFTQTNVKEETFGEDYQDPADELKGFESSSTDVDVIDGVKSDGFGGLAQKLIEGDATNLSAMRRGTAIGTESSGFRGIASNIGAKVFGQRDLEAESRARGFDPLADVDDVSDMGRGGARGVGNLVSRFNSAGDGPKAPDIVRVNPRTPTAKPVEQIAEEAEEPTEAVSSTLSAAKPAEILTDADTGAAVATSTGEATAGAIDAGTKASEAAIQAGGGIDTKALEVGAEALKTTGGFAGATGRVALAGVGAIGKGMKVLGPVANVAFLGDQTYNEVSSLAKGHGLSGDGTVGKVGGVMSEIGDAAATYGSYLALAGPVGDVAALGVELGGGLLSLAGGILGDIGQDEAEKKAKAAADNKVAADKLAAKKASETSNTSVQVSEAATAANYSGQGTIAQAARSAVRAF